MLINVMLIKKACRQNFSLVPSSSVPRGFSRYYLDFLLHEIKIDKILYFIKF